MLYLDPMLNFLVNEGLPVSAPIKLLDGSYSSPNIKLVHQGMLVH